MPNQPEDRITAASLMAQMGLVLPQAGGVTVAQRQALVKASTAGAFQAIIAGALEDIGRMDPKWENVKNRKGILDDLRHRLIMNPDRPGVPVIDYVTFNGVPGKSREVTIFSHEDGTLVSGAIPFNRIKGAFRIPVPGQEDDVIEVQPIRFTDAVGNLIPYVDVNGDSMGEMLIIAFVPKKRGGVFTSWPLGLGEERLLQRWDDICDRAESQGATQGVFNRITRIASAIRSNVPFLYLTPLGMGNSPEISLFENRSQLDKALRKYNELPAEERQVPTSPFTILAILFGKKVLLAKSSRAPTKVDGTFPEGVWEIREGYKSIRVKYIGQKGKVGRIGSKTQQVEALQVNPFAALGMKPQSTAPGAMVARRVSQLVSHQHDLSNPLYVASLEQGMAGAEDSPDQVRVAMRQLGALCVGLINTMLMDIVDHLRRELERTGFSGRPEVKAILGDNMTPAGLKAALSKDTSECPLATWIGENLTVDGEYASDSWVLKEIRRVDMKAMAKAEGIEMPKKAKKNSKSGSARPSRPAKKRTDPMEQQASPGDAVTPDPSSGLETTGEPSTPIATPPVEAASEQEAATPA